MRTSVKLILLGLITISTISLTNQNNKQSCKIDSDCLENNYCDLNQKFCVHKKFLPTSTTEIIGLVLILLTSALSNAGGVGGGGLVIPILLLMFKFYTHEAIPISKLTIFTGALTSFLLGFKQMHPYRKAITIDFNIPYLIVPMLLFGTMVGISLNKVMPPWIILVSLTLVLVLNTYKTLSKARNLQIKENKDTAPVQISTGKVEMGELRYNRQLDEDGISTGNPSDASTPNNGRMSISSDKNDSPKQNYNKLELGESMHSGTNPNFSSHNDSKVNDITAMEIEANSQQLAVEEVKDLRRLPSEKLIIMAISYIYMLTISFLKGSDHFNSIINVQICSFEYWGIYSLYVPFAFLITYYTSNKIRKEYNYRKSIGYKYFEQDIKWTKEICLKFPVYGFFSGLLAGLLGIGGGTILGPLLLEIGLHPVVSTSTSNFLVLFTSSSTSIQFILLGMMNVDYGTACTVSSTVGSFLGTIIIQRLIQRTKRNSYLIYALGIGLGLSMILIPYQTLIDLIRDIERKRNIWVFNSPC